MRLVTASGLNKVVIINITKKTFINKKAQSWTIILKERVEKTKIGDQEKKKYNEK